VSLARLRSPRIIGIGIGIGIWRLAIPARC
jgi:hypothetical protein